MINLRVGWCMLLIVLCFAGSVQALEGKISLEADRMDYFMEENQALARGNVVAFWGNYELRADEVLLDMRENFIRATGSVYFKQDDVDFTSDEVTYYFEEERVVVLKARGRSKIEGENEEELDHYIYLHSERIEADQEKIMVDRGRVTTCDLDRSHYYIQASSIEVRPGDVLILRHMVFWEFSGRLPLFYWPYLALSLEDRDQRITPEFGRGDRGWYMKMAFNYFLDQQYGRILWDIYQQTGMALGVHHFYLDQGRDQAYIHLYTQQNWDERNIPSFEGEWKHVQSLGAWQLDAGASADYYPDQRWDTDFQKRLQGSIGEVNLDSRWDLELDYFMEDRIDYEFDALLRSRWDNLILDLETEVEARQNLEEGRETWHTLDSEWELYANYTFGTRERIRLDLGYETSVREGEDFASQWDGRLEYSGAMTGIRYNVEVKRDVPSLGSTDPHFYILPQVKVALQPRLLPIPFARELSPFSLDVLAGYYDEGRTDTKAVKGNVQLQYSETFRPLPWANLSVTQRGGVSAYSTGDQLYDYYSQNRLTLQPLPYIRTTLTHTFRYPYGDSPFHFDRKRDPENELTGEIRYSTGPWLITLSSGHNFEAGTFRDIDGQIRYSPSRDLSMQLRTGYSIENETWRNIRAITDWTPHENLTLRLDSDYNIANQAWQNVRLRAGLQLEDFLFQGVYDRRLRSGSTTELRDHELEARLTWDFHEDLAIASGVRYDFLKGELEMGEFQLQWDLHCRQLLFTYDHARTEFRVQYNILAFPGQKIEFGTTGDALLFDFDLGDLIDEE